MSLYDKIRTHVIDATTLVFAGNPLYAMLETYGRQFTNHESFDARKTATVLAYLGTGFLYAKGRDLSHKAWKITDNTREAIINTHDALYCFALNTAINIPFYYYTGHHDIKELIIDSTIIGAIGIPIGVAATYVLDVARDVTGIKHSHRTPDWMKHKNTKKYFLPALVATSIAMTAGVEKMHSPTKPQLNKSIQVVETMKP